MSKNKHGLQRYIPAEIARQVRKQSKFGCVICRSGFYQYEHIDPEFHEAERHIAAGICCLCAACHDRVTRKQLSKETVRNHYRLIQAAVDDEVEAPNGPLDFHDGRSEVAIGGLGYIDDLRSIVRYHGRDYLSVSPGCDGEPGSVSALFQDDDGTEVLRLEENAWTGNTDAWDIEVVGQRLTVRKKLGEISLRLRLDPPGRIVIERLDMRVGDAHVLASEFNYAIGRRMSPSGIFWFRSQVNISRSSAAGSLLEFITPLELELRHKMFGGRGQHFVVSGDNALLDNYVGMGWKAYGMVVGSFTGGIQCFGMVAGGPRPLDAMRQKVFHQPEELDRFIAQGSHWPS